MTRLACVYRKVNCRYTVHVHHVVNVAEHVHMQEATETSDAGGEDQKIGGMADAAVEVSSCRLVPSLEHF